MERRGGKEDACQSEKRHATVRSGCMGISTHKVWTTYLIDLSFCKKIKVLCFLESAFWGFLLFLFSCSIGGWLETAPLVGRSSWGGGKGSSLLFSLSFSPANRAATVPLDTQRRRMKGETLKGRIYGGPLFDPRPKGEDGGKEMLLQFSFFFGRGRGL